MPFRPAFHEAQRFPGLGTGSVLLEGDPPAEDSESEFAMQPWVGRLRYFSPLEVARLMGFKLDGCQGVCVRREGRQGVTTAPGSRQEP